MNKAKILQILLKSNALDDIDSGPTAVVLKDGKKKISIRTRKSGETIFVTTGKIFLRTFKISVSELNRI